LADALPLARETDNPCLLAEVSGVQAAVRLAEAAEDRATAASREALELANACGEHRLGLVARLQAGEVARSVSELELVEKEADTAGLAPIAAATHLALARVRFAAGQVRDALREADLAVARASRLGQREILFQAHHLAGRCRQAQGDRAGAADRYGSALGPLEEMRQGLRGDALTAFLARSETAEYGRTAAALLSAEGRREEAARLEKLLRP
jgi:tetratricopeptide (TPR) repeat protein